MIGHTLRLAAKRATLTLSALCMTGLAAAPAFAAPEVWTAFQAGGTGVQLKHYANGLEAPATEGYPVLYGSSPIPANEFHGFQVMGDGSVWAAIQAGGLGIQIEHYTNGLGSPALEGYTLKYGSDYVPAGEFHGFQVMDDGSVWAAIQAGGLGIQIEHYTNGLGAPATAGYTLKYGSDYVPASEFHGFQVMDDGSVWAAIQAGGLGIQIDHYTNGLGAPAPEGYTLKYGSDYVPASEFHGFQVMDDGSVWAAIQAGGLNIQIEHYTNGLGAPAPEGYTLMSGSSYVPANEFHGFQIMSPSTAPAVPEPATWAMLIAGFAGIGLAMRRSRGRHTVNRPLNRLALRTA